MTHGCQYYYESEEEGGGITIISIIAIVIIVITIRIAPMKYCLYQQPSFEPDVESQIASGKACSLTAKNINAPYRWVVGGG